jgi:hypothetical protein
MSDLLTKLKQYRPSVLVAHDQDDEQLRINVPDVRKKWERVLGALDEVNWVRVDMLDKKGGHLHRHMRSIDDTAPTELDELVRGSNSAIAPQLAPLVQIMLKAQEVAVSRHQQGQQQLLDATYKMIETISRRLDLQEKQYEHALQLNHSLSVELMQSQLAAMMPDQNDENDGRPHSDAMIGALMPRLLGAAFGNAEPKRPKNGVDAAARQARSRPAADVAATE